MKTETIVILCGVVTFALRWLPFWWASKARTCTNSNSERTRKLLLGVGPAAIAGLLTVSLWDVAAPDFKPGQIIPALISMALIILIRMKFKGSIAAPTLTGAMMYGVLTQLFR
ncbi:AzlD domain-containing protein [Pseudomonas sp. CBSPBW29]|uniref:AzlD domain-containing protein n=1 Tax=Pseudomonas sp. CBS TaxID=2971912 RepID=UPI0021AC3FA2|nr:AzlD domain-containing protein [Pseudomonas sp. CBS]WEL43614.1 AzlD domain-containing protein [Pseudomonas sp. CBSPBW29]WEL64682.1 AzlD domain-containing protein [Pseudomonas sp. CBSPGW29]WEL68148.1 AzlD domain-containing protein [Pseudomonas sp. CBSPCGW29]WEL75168.1 AzlD domain-containing protein [Pseudomonas sp. CBSPAW29]WEL80587.1 AzlD domain-containing protein [Pseudomonas sp. CBSPCAW29]WEL89102.1 AzlD domain-containing protein [Pseudomonas sp. CBSPCBW29]